MTYVFIALQATTSTPALIAQAQQASVASVLEKNGYTQFVALLKRVGAYEAAKKQFTGTILAPSDAVSGGRLSGQAVTVLLPVWGMGRCRAE
jgi:hypothetical protein